jgi:hypothetical protein
VLLGATAGLVGGVVIMVTVCKVLLDDVSFECDAIGRVVSELGSWPEADGVAIADIEGGLASIVSRVATWPQPTAQNERPKSLSEMR